MRKIFLVLLVLLGAYEVNAQDEYNFTPTAVLPPPVNAASINKGGDVSVNLSCGTPNVNIPLVDVKSRFLSFPVSANYASNGIRVNEIASNVGLGWSLNCGGSVTRTTLGIPDEERPSYNTDFTNFTKTSLTTLDRPTMNYLQYKRDRESDVFNFSVNGFIQGKFILDQNFKPKLLDEKNYKVSLLSTNILDGFQIVDDKGIVFIFNISDTSTYERGDCGGGNDRHIEVVNSWHLTRIIKPYQDTIYFNYVDDNYSYLSDITENESVCITSGIGGCGGQSPGSACPLFSGQYTDCVTYQSVQGKALKEIVFNNGKVVFGYTSGRKDLKGGSALTSISLMNTLDTIKYISLIQNASYYQKGHLFVASDTTLRYRLTLRSINISDSKATPISYKYDFSYLKEDSLPARTSTAQDLYGLPNGKNSNRYFLTSIEDEYPDLNYYGLGYPRRYGDRRIDTNFVRAGLLSRIVYPTGGYDSIVYDWNRKIEQYVVYHYKTAGFDQCAPTSAGVTDSTLLNIPFKQSIVINLNVAPREPGYQGHDETIFQIKLASNNQVVYSSRLNLASNGGELTKILELNPGNYKIIQTTEGRYICGYSDIKYENMPPDTLYRDVPLGGVSVSRIISVDPLSKNSTTKYYSYKDRKTGAHSTFPLVENARYVYRNNVKRFMNCDDFYDCLGISYCAYLVHGSSMINPESMIGGNFFYHNSVIETTTGEDSIDRCVSHDFRYNETFSGDVQNGSYIPNTPYGIYPDMLIGEVNTTYYSYNRLTKETIPYRKIDRTYATNRSLIVNNFNVVKIYEPPCSSTPVSEVEKGAYNINSYPVFYQKKQLIATYDTTYSNDGVLAMANTILNTYTNDVFSMPRQAIYKTSKGEQRTQTFRYFFDDPSGSMYTPLLNRNKIVPIEVIDSVNSKFIHKNTIGYKYTSEVNNIVEPYRYEELTYINEPGSVTEKTAFDTYGNVLEVKSKAQITSFLWDYNSCYLIAAVTNANQQDIAYTSFEADGTGNWTIYSGAREQTTAITGRSSLNFGGAGMGTMALLGIVKTGLDPAEEYILSYWTKNTVPYTISGTQGTPLKGKTVDGWTYFEHRLKGITSVTVAGNGYIDELRLYPLNAQMTTYTYTPSIGITALCDVNNQITYYEYDGLGRLRLTKDQNGKILRLYDYQYQKPITQ